MLPGYSALAVSGYNCLLPLDWTCCSSVNSVVHSEQTWNLHVWKCLNNMQIVHALSVHESEKYIKIASRPWADTVNRSKWCFRRSSNVKGEDGHPVDMVRQMTAS